MKYGLLPWADDPQYTCCDQNPIVATQHKYHSTRAHQCSPCHENTSTPQAIGDQGKEEADSYIAQKRQGHEETNSSVRIAEKGEVEGEDQSGEAISKEAGETGEEEEFYVD